MESEDLIVTPPYPMSDRDNKSIVSRPTSELVRTRPGAAAIIDRVVDDATDVVRRREVDRHGTGDCGFGGLGYGDSDKEDGSSPQNDLGNMNHDGNGAPEDDDEAAHRTRRAAEQGNADAQNRLGDMYCYGWGVPEDDAEAVKWYRRAAEQDHAPAQSNFGDMYRYGWGVPQDYAEAVRWYRRAAEQGNADAQNRLGVMYDLGKSFRTTEGSYRRR